MSSLETVLAVDDNPVNLEVIQETLDGLYRVEIADNGVDALAIAKQLRPSAVLLDVMMPGLDGYQVCRHIKQSFDLNTTRVIMVSARVALSDKLQGYEAGADSYITKPFDEEELLVKLDFAIRCRKLEQTCGAIGDVLAFIATLRDSGHLQHLDRTRTYTHLLAERTLASACENPAEIRSFLDELHYACVLKDIGMLAVPARIAESASPACLSRHDLELLKEHTLVGSRLLSRMAKQAPELTLFGMAAEVARTHHERFDGAGYPEGLQGETIPLAARMVSVIERFESLLETMEAGTDTSFQAVCEEMAADRGAALDPTLTDSFIEVLDELNRESQAPIPNA